MSILFSLPYLVACRLTLSTRRWNNQLLVLPDQSIEDRLEEYLESFTVSKEHHLLKIGKGRRVSVVVNDDGKKVLKLYIPKKGLTGLLHALFPSKAFVECCMALRLFSLGIPVPHPFVVIERRWFPGCGKSILVLKYLEGCEVVSKVFPSLKGENRTTFLEGLARFAKRLHSTCFCHSDLWARNILVSQDQKSFFIIDLDGGFFNCRLLPFRAPVNLAQLLFSLNKASNLTAEEVELFLRSYGATRRALARTIKAYNRKFGLWPWREEIY